MEAKKETKNQKSMVNHQRPKLGVEIHHHKILPNLNKNIFDKVSTDNEWEQEYYIIYNSYALEEKDF